MASDGSLVKGAAVQIVSPLPRYDIRPEQVKERARPGEICDRAHDADDEVVQPKGFVDHAPRLIVHYHERPNIEDNEDDTHKHKAPDDHPKTKTV